METVACISNLTKDYRRVKSTSWFGLLKQWEPKRALDNFNLTLRRGEFLGLIGPNGSGKTTMMKILSGILVPTSGNVNIMGHIPWQRNSQYLKKIGVLFGNRSNLIFDVAVRDSLELYKEIYGLSDHFYKQRLTLLTELLELEDIIDAPVRKLSFGQRMRAEMASVFLHKPEFVMLDEPTIGMDIVVKDRVYNFLKKINHNDEVTIIFTTHIMSDIEELCERVIVLSNGNTIWDGKTEELKKTYIKNKKITFEFTGKLEPPLVKKHKIEVAGAVATVIVEKGKEAEAIKDITKETDVLSLSIEEPDLESIIRKIYREGKA